MAHWTMQVVGAATALALFAGEAGAAVPAHPRATAQEIDAAKRILEADGYKDLAVVASDDQMVTLAATKDGTKSVLDVDPMTRIILPHVDLPPVPAQLAPVTGLPANPR